MGILDFLTREKADLKELKAQGAIVVDVRSAGEFQSANMNGSKNIPLDRIDSSMEEIKSWNKPVVFCCVSGNRSGMATTMAERAGVEAYNGGPWTSVQWEWV